MSKGQVLRALSYAVSACLSLGCAAGGAKALGSGDCASRPRAALVTASDYDVAGNLVAFGYSDGSFELRRDATEVLACGAHEAPISNLAFSPDGAALATGDIVGRVSLSSVAEQETEPLIELASEIYGLAFSPSGSIIALSSGTDIVLVGRAGTVMERATLPSAVGAVAFSRDGRQLIAAGGTLTFLSVPGLGVERTVMLRQKGEPPVVVTDVKLGPDGRTIGLLVLGGAAIFDLGSGRLSVATPSDWDPVGLRFARDGTIAVFARHRFYIGPPEPERLANESSVPAGALLDLEFRRDGTLLVVGGPLDPPE